MTRAELEEIAENAGITEIQLEIIRLKYFDKNDYSVRKICDTLSISDNAYFYQQRQAVEQVNTYFNSKNNLHYKSRWRNPPVFLFSSFIQVLFEFLGSFLVFSW